MNKLVTNAPIQNTTFDSGNILRQLTPLLAAEYQRIVNPEFASQSLPLHLWNGNVLSQQADSSSENYSLLHVRRIDERYASDQFRHFKFIKDYVSSDLDEDFLKWGKQKVVSLFDAGDLRDDVRAVYACDTCEANVSMYEISKKHCACCDGGIVQKITKRLLYITTDLQTISDSLTASPSHKDKQVLTSSLRGVENKSYVVNKRRLVGISLDDLGFEKDVLDPRIALGLLAAYTADKHGADAIEVIVGRAGLHLNTPQFVTAARSMLSQMPSIEMRGIVRAPTEYIKYLEHEGHSRAALLERYFNRVVPKLFDMKDDMSPDFAESLMFSRKKQNRNI